MYKDRTHTGITNRRRCYTYNILVQNIQVCDIQCTGTEAHIAYTNRDTCDVQDLMVIRNTQVHSWCTVATRE